jgi:hypothetical protein
MPTPDCAGLSCGNSDFRSEDVIYERFRKSFPAEWGDRAIPGAPSQTGFYNTLFMWPLLVFGYQNFLGHDVYW